MSGTTGTARALVELPVGRRRTVAAAAALAAITPPGAASSAPSAPGAGAPAAPAAAAVLTQFQQRVGLPATGQADDATVARIVAETAHHHVATSAMRTSRVQHMLAKAGFAPDPQEVGSRTLGAATTDQVRRFQQARGLTVDGLVGDQTLGALSDAALTATLASKRQTHLLQRRIQRAARIRGLDVTIDPAETSSRTAGASTQAAVRELQASLGLPVTGTVDTATFERVNSVAASRRTPAAKVAAPDPAALGVVPRALRLNMANKHVPTLQRALAFLGHPPRKPSSRRPPSAPAPGRPSSPSRPPTGCRRPAPPTVRHCAGSTNRSGPSRPGPSTPCASEAVSATPPGPAGAASPSSLATDPPVGDPVVLGTRTTLGNGFYDLPYAVPTDPASGQPLSPLALRVRFVDAGGATIGTKRLVDPTPITWVNFTEGPYPYRGTSVHEAQLAAVRAAGVADLTTLVETGARHDITRVAQLAGLTQDDMMRLVLAARAGRQLGGELDATVCFAFLAQSLPSSLPDDLLAQTHEWTLIDQLTDLVAAGIAGTEPELAASTLDSALTQNLVPVSLAARRDVVLAGLAAADARPRWTGRCSWATRPCGARCSAARSRRPRSTPWPTRSWPPAAWARGSRACCADSPDAYGGAAAVASLRRRVDVGVVAKTSSRW